MTDFKDAPDDRDSWGSRKTDHADPNFGRACMLCKTPIRAGGRHEHTCPEMRAIAEVHTLRRERDEARAALAAILKAAEKVDAILAPLRDERDNREHNWLVRENAMQQAFAEAIDGWGAQQAMSDPDSIARVERMWAAARALPKD